MEEQYVKRSQEENRGGSNEGFTLVEMLIVVAIIAILIAISIPLVDSALQRAKHATDAANERAAKAAIILVNIGDLAAADIIEDGYYDAKAGKIIKSGTIATGYGQHKKGTADHTGKIIKASYNGGVVYMEWVAATEAATPVATPLTASTGLCSDVSSYTH